MVHIECIRCGQRFGTREIIYTCKRCGGLLDVKYDYSAIEGIKKEGIPSVWKYEELLPSKREDAVSIQEGGTPLYGCDALAKSIGVHHLYIKYEGMNPTGSFKDRGMTIGVTKALELNIKTVACASTGNTSASLSAYAAKAGIFALILLPRGKVALGKVAQAMMYGGKILSINGNFDDALALIRELCDEMGFYLLNSINPYRLEGQKTIAFEICDQLGWSVPDRVVLPVGNAGNISAAFKGFKELEMIGVTDTIPMMTGIQAEGASPIVRAIKTGREMVPEPNPETIATAIRIGDPVNAEKAIYSMKESHGTAEMVTDDEIIAAQKDLARLEGIGVEPASAASVAGLRKLVEGGTVDKDETIVCVATGNLLKDSEGILRTVDRPIEVEARKDEIMKLLCRY
jgi:threonine synthase